MTVFAAALATLFADPNMAVDGVLTPGGGGAAVACRVVWKQPDRDWSGLGVGATVPGRLAEVRTAEAAAVEEDWTLAVAGETLAVSKASQPDDDRLLWLLEFR